MVQGGLEIPYLITFEGPGKEVQKVKKLVTVALLTTAAIESSTDESQANKRKIGEGSVEMSEDISEWVQCGGVIPTDYDRKILATVEQADRSAHEFCPDSIATADS